MRALAFLVIVAAPFVHAAEPTAGQLENWHHWRGPLATGVGPKADPPTSWDSPLAAFEAAYENEKTVSKSIDDLYELAGNENDHATRVMLQWFITEQVEEEASTKQAVDRLKLAGSDSSALLVLDQQFGSRTEA